MYPWWAVCIVVARELAVDGLRLVAVEQGIVIPAGTLGKYKTNAQFFSILSALLFLPGWLTMALVILMSVLTIISGVQYFRGAEDLLKHN
jgi:CDP-diacylglycerol--glycerol-3-phosphate 3-phosphatidyltransferase